MLILSFLLFISGIVATVKFFYESKLMTKEIVVNKEFEQLAPWNEEVKAEIKRRAANLKK